MTRATGRPAPFSGDELMNTSSVSWELYVALFIFRGVMLGSRKRQTGTSKGKSLDAVDSLNTVSLLSPQLPQQRQYMAHVRNSDDHLACQSAGSSSLQLSTHRKSQLCRSAMMASDPYDKLCGAFALTLQDPIVNKYSNSGITK